MRVRTWSAPPRTGASSGGIVAAVRFVAVMALFGSVAGCDIGGAEGEGVLTREVSRGDLVISFTERGNVEAGNSVPIYSLVEGRSTIVTIVPEGTFVEEGDVLVDLDSSELTQDLNQQEISVEGAEATLLQAKEQTKIQQSLSDSEVRKAEVDWEQAKLELRKYIEGDYKLALRQARADVTLAEEELVRAKNKFDWTQKLAQKGYVTGTELIADRLSVHRAEIEKEQSTHALSVLLEYTHRRDLTTYTFAVEQAEDALERAKSKRDAEMSKVRADESAKEKTLELSRKRLEKIRDQLGKTTILAPGPGMVVYHTERWRRERVIEQGAEVHENQLLMNLPDVSSMAVNLKVHESWVDQVRPGLPVLISIDALPQLNLRGKITKVGLLPDQVNRYMNPDLKVYETSVMIDDSQDVELLKPGMSAKAQVLITVRKDVLYVPVQSVTTIDGEPVCFVQDGSGFVPRKVETGKFNDAFIEISSGLEDGDVVQLIAPQPSGTANGQEDFEEAESLVRESEAASQAAGGGSGRSPRGRNGRGGPGAGDRSGGDSGRPEPAAFRPGGGGAGAPSGMSRSGGEGGSRGGRPPSGMRRPGGDGTRGGGAPAGGRRSRGDRGGGGRGGGGAGPGSGGGATAGGASS